MMETSPPGNSRFTRQALCWKKKQTKKKTKTNVWENPDFQVKHKLFMKIFMWF